MKRREGPSILIHPEGVRIPGALRDLASFRSRLKSIAAARRCSKRRGRTPKDGGAPRFSAARSASNGFRWVRGWCGIDWIPTDGRLSYDGLDQLTVTARRLRVS
ncbi:MAG: hypothetical protein HY716_04725 [Planctomycetes bacterium]|nr:hypothetical protein [Planctomycetota bacterium]